MITFHSTLIFTKTPLKNHFRYRDIFQVFPAEHLEGLPSSTMQKHYPVILEYWVSDNEPAPVMELFQDMKGFLEPTTRQIIKQDLFLSLLSCFTNHQFFRYTDINGMWGIPAPALGEPEEQINSQSSAWYINFFYTPALAAQLKIKVFSEQRYPDMAFIRHFPYYQDDPNLDMDPKREITFPETIYMDLDSYFAQNKDTREVLDAAIAYSVAAAELRYARRTMSVMAAFTAVETMVNFEYRDFEAPKCDACGQLQFKVMKKYRDYLLKYLGDTPHNKKKFNAFYGLRSRIVHAGERLKSERLFAEIPDDVRDEEFVTQLEIIMLSKFAIVQWLLKNRQSTAIQ